jgi:nucleotide-binding universal stress UspA family protein
MFQRILMATDFSSGAEAARQVAMSLARAHGAELLLVHVYEDALRHTYVEGRTLTSLGELQASQREWAETELAARAAEARSAGVAARSVLLTGSAAEQIAEAARSHGADLLVIGTQGRTGLDRLLLGSVAERVVRLAPCPVLTVKDDAGTERARQAA